MVARRPRTIAEGLRRLAPHTPRVAASFGRIAAGTQRVVTRARMDARDLKQEGGDSAFAALTAGVAPKRRWRSSKRSRAKQDQRKLQRRV